MANIIETLREKAVDKLFTTASFSNCFSTWITNIRTLIGNNPSPTSILNLGDNLASIFKLTAVSGRGQGTVSSGGTAWESLVCWYLNLCSIGSRTVIIRQNKQLIPTPISNAITVSYSSFPSNTESDIIAITFPDNMDFTQNYNFTSITQLKKDLDNLCITHFNLLGVGIIQSKTNWNDNAQIPMLWDIVYSSQGFSNRNISIGLNGFNLGNFKKFTYSFVTVPSQSDLSKFKSNTTSVMRVKNISGGNYWGHPTNAGIANSLKEIFNKNFQMGFLPSSQRQILQTNITTLATTYSYFKI